MEEQPTEDDSGLPPIDDLLSKADEDKLRAVVPVLLSRLHQLPSAQLRALYTLLKGVDDRRIAAGLPKAKPGESLADDVARAAPTADVSAAAKTGLTILSGLVADLPDEQRAALLADLLGGRFWHVEIGANAGAELAALMAPTAPEIAEHFRSLKSPEAVLVYVDILIGLLQLLVALIALPDDPPAPQGPQISINIDTTHITNAPAAPTYSPKPDSTGPSKGVGEK